MSKPKNMDLSVIRLKEYLSAYETSLLFNMSVDYVRSLMKAPDCNFKIYVGANKKRQLIHRETFAQYLKAHGNANE